MFRDPDSAGQPGGGFDRPAIVDGVKTVAIAVAEFIGGVAVIHRGNQIPAWRSLGARLETKITLRVVAAQLRMRGNGSTEQRHYQHNHYRRRSFVHALLLMICVMRRQYPGSHTRYMRLLIRSNLMRLLQKYIWNRAEGVSIYIASIALDPAVRRIGIDVRQALPPIGGSHIRKNHFHRAARGHGRFSFPGGKRTIFGYRLN